MENIKPTEVPKSAELVLSIVSGPDRFEMFHSMAFGKPVTFKLKEAGKEEVGEWSFILTSMEVESGGGYSWNIEGYAITKISTPRVVGFYRCGSLVSGRLIVLLGK